MHYGKGWMFVQYIFSAYPWVFSEYPCSQPSCLPCRLEGFMALELDLTTNAQPIDLALQGGGSHGAFTWGVLDCLLEDDSLDFSAISGTSAGALNAAVMITGYAANGRRGAREALTEFWREISRSGSIFSPFSAAGNNNSSNPFSVENLPGYQWMGSLFRSFSPYELNPLNLNPLRDVVRRHVDPEAIHRSEVALFVTATSVRTGQARLFTGQDVTLDTLMASACLPFLFQAVEIDGEPFWDGGYTGNPAIFPLIYDSYALDVLLVRIIPLAREGTPTRSMDIIDRVSEITFNASLISEMRAINFVSRLLKENKLDKTQYKDLRLHMVADDKGLAPFNASSKSNTDRAFLEQLFDLGRTAAQQWLAHDRQWVGVKSSMDLEGTFLHTKPPLRRPKQGA
jgi:NTE family protein